MKENNSSNDAKGLFIAASALALSAVAGAGIMQKLDENIIISHINEKQQIKKTKGDLEIVISRLEAKNKKLEFDKVFFREGLNNAILSYRNERNSLSRELHTLKEKLRSVTHERDEYKSLFDRGLNLFEASNHKEEYNIKKPQLNEFLKHINSLDIPRLRTPSQLLLKDDSFNTHTQDGKDK